MSRLIGESGERWQLSDAVDALGQSARAAGRPGWIWIAGIFYPSAEFTAGVLGVAFRLLERSTDLDMPAVDADWGFLSAIDISNPIKILMILLTYRLAVGLAFVAGPEIWERCVARSIGAHSPRLGAAWRAADGITLSAVGLWLIVQLLTFAALLAVLGPVVIAINALGLEEASIPLFVALSPLAGMILLYTAVLQVINQLALHSLACNRRGATSAMIHAWRLVRNSPWSAVRAGIGDLLLTGVYVGIFTALSIVGAILCFIAPLVALALAAFKGFIGTTRAGYWARVYRALGGTIPADNMPGIETAEGW